MNEGTCIGLILYGDVETVKQLMANFVKVETNVHLCPLASRGELVLLYSFGRITKVSDPLFHQAINKIDQPRNTLINPQLTMMS